MFKILDQARGQRAARPSQGPLGDFLPMLKIIRRSKISFKYRDGGVSFSGDGGPGMPVVQRSVEDLL